MADDQGTPDTGTRDSALRPADSDLHPADHGDDLTGNTPGSDTAGDPGGGEDAVTEDAVMEDAVVDDAGWPADDAADGDALGSDLPDADLPDADPGLPETAPAGYQLPGSGVSDHGFTDPDLPLPGAEEPGDGTVGTPLPPDQPDALRTAMHGRESAEAAAITSDSAPRPTERPAD